MTFRQVAQRIRVPAGFVLLPLLLIASRPTIGWFIPGCGLAVLGLGVRAWASGYLRKNRELTTAGPYAHTRNPLYLGTFLLGTGVALSTGALWFVAVFVTFYWMIYAPVMSAEASTMGDLFPGEYEDYRREVPLLLPRVTPYPGRLRRQFERSAYMRHREYRAAIGLVVVYALMAAKLLMLG